MHPDPMKQINVLGFNLTSTSSLILIFSFIYLITFIVKEWKKSKSSNGIKRRLPPGPKKLPLIGNLHQVIGEWPHRSLRDLSKKYGPLMHLKLGEVPAIVVSSPEYAKQILKTFDLTFADRPPSLGSDITSYNRIDIVFGPYSEYWRQMRKVCILEMLSLKNVKSFGYIRNYEASGLVRSIQADSGKPVNLTDRIYWFSTSITCRAAFGQELKDKDAFINFLRISVADAGGFELVDFFPSSKILNIINWKKYKLLMMRRKTDSVLQKLVHEHREKFLAARNRGADTIDEDELGGAEALVDVLVRLQQTGEYEFPIADQNIKAILFNIFSAGTETSSTTIDWAMSELMRSPHVLAKAQAEVRGAFKGKETINEANVHVLKYLPLVIKETLRMHPPIALLPRASREECEIDGYHIPLQAKVLINLWAIGRDPNYWEEPETFMPERFEDGSLDFLGSHFEYIPFGSGRRICPGLSFGLAFMELILAKLLFHFDWALPEGMKPSDMDMSDADGITVSRKQSLIVIPSPYNPSKY